jgi:hypothetical protein
VNIKNNTMRYLLFVTLTMGMLLFSAGQKRSGFGFHAGINVTGVYDNTNGYYDGLDPLDGYEAGVRYNLKFGPLGICAEANYKSLNYNDPPTFLFLDGMYTYTPGGTVNVNYLSIPVVMKLYLGGFNIHFGGQVSQLINGTSSPDGLQDFSFTDDQNYVTLNGEETWIWNDMDVAAVFGFGIDRKRGLYLTFRSTASITPLLNTDVTDAYLPGINIDDFLRLVSNSFTVGYKF